MKMLLNIGKAIAMSGDFSAGMMGLKVGKWVVRDVEDSDEEREMSWKEKG